MMSKFDRSWLVQRLETPFKSGQFKDNPFSFGGGYKNGGLTDQAMDLIRDIFSFDYMGAAEFEFGALPKTLGKIAKVAEDDGLSAFTVDIDGQSVYAIAPTEWQNDVEERIRDFAKGDWGKDSYSLKEATRLSQVLNKEPYTDRLAGWLELDNGFFFFTDHDMFAKTARLFGVEVETADAPEPEAA